MNISYISSKLNFRYLFPVYNYNQNSILLENFGIRK